MRVGVTREVDCASAAMNSRGEVVEEEVVDREDVLRREAKFGSQALAHWRRLKGGVRARVSVMVRCGM